MTRPSTPSLPREIEADPDHEAIRARLAAPGRPLWPGGQVTVTVLPLSSSLASALGAAYRGGHLVLGLERADDVLAAEARGLALVARRAGTTAGARGSRLLLVSGDGAQRLYRHVQRLPLEHAPPRPGAKLSTHPAPPRPTTTGREAPGKG